MSNYALTNKENNMKHKLKPIDKDTVIRILRNILKYTVGMPILLVGALVLSICLIIVFWIWLMFTIVGADNDPIWSELMRIPGLYVYIFKPIE